MLILNEFSVSWVRRKNSNVPQQWLRVAYARELFRFNDSISLSEVPCRARSLVGAWWDD